MSPTPTDAGAEVTPDAAKHIRIADADLRSIIQIQPDLDDEDVDNWASEISDCLGTAKSLANRALRELEKASRDLAALAGDGWVSVKERMPESVRYVLAWCPEREMAFQCTNKDGAWWIIGGGQLYPEVTHWMAVPRFTPAMDATREGGL